MCGIAGIFDHGGLSPGAPDALRRMTDALAHRGPDAAGHWQDADRGIALGHRRLSIIDLSETGAQPMVSASGRYVLITNGEIYNHRELRAEIDASDTGMEWRGTSDTEVLLEAIARWGLDRALTQAHGMFALALWDRQRRILSLARDRMGEKPLHLADLGGGYIFASELKALTAHPAWRGEIDRTAVALCLRHGQIPGPRTLWRGVEKIPPGAIVDIFPDGTRQQRLYWDLAAEARAARQSRYTGTTEMATDELDRLLHQAVDRQMVADVPLGAFLSGGIDSSAIVSVMQARSATPVETFALGFHETGRDEAGHARAIARHLGTSHQEIYFTDSEARDLLVAMPEVYDEPFADSSQLATYMIARFARQKVTVALSGDAGDELFGGYNRYAKARALWESGLPGRLTRTAEHAALSLLDDAVMAPAGALGVRRIFGRGVSAAHLSMARRRAMLRARQPVAGYDAMFTSLEHAHRLVPGAAPVREPLLESIAGEPGWSVLEQASFLDMARYLPDDILVKVDRAAMASSLETRVPLLDADIVRFAFSLPDSIKLAGGKPKGILRNVLARYVPPALWERPKSGFGVPIGEWLSGALRPVADDLFSEAALKRTGLIEPAPVMALWSEFRRGGPVRPKVVWTLFVTQLYLERLTGAARAAA